MILTYGDQTIDLFSENDFPCGPPEQIFLGLSGGLDSSALLYLICTHFPDIEIFPYAGNDANHPMDFVNAINVRQWFQEKFPEVKIHNHYMFKFDADVEPWISQAKDLIESGKKPGFASVRGVAKTLVMDHTVDTYQLKNIPNSQRISGMTANPPSEEMKSNNFYDMAERRRDKGQNLSVFKGKVYHPLINVDKKFVAGVYKEHGLMDELFYLTGSCVGSSEAQGWGQHGCGVCFWCNEKKWAFGEY
jgi:3'-phosphoadenosine 5'-phosphosulfate sulfotransferase (PAPS reductase)/FAD synthetase